MFVKVVDKSPPPGALAPIKDPLAFAAASHVEHKINKYTGLPYVEIISVRRHKGVFLPTRDILPAYDMSKIDPRGPKFYSEDFDKHIYKYCCRTPEGRHIINTMKNEKTLRIVNEYTKEFNEQIPVDREKLKNGHIYMFKRFLNVLFHSPLAEKEDKIINYIPFLKLGLRKEEVWAKFKESGLVAKITSFKKEKI